MTKQKWSTKELGRDADGLSRTTEWPKIWNDLGEDVERGKGRIGTKLSMMTTP